MIVYPLNRREEKTVRVMGWLSLVMLAVMLAVFIACAR